MSTFSLPLPRPTLSISIQNVSCPTQVTFFFCMFLVRVTQGNLGSQGLQEKLRWSPFITRLKKIAFELYTIPVNYADPFKKQPKMNVTTKRLKSNLHPLHFTESSPFQKKLLLDDDQFKECAQGWPLYIGRFDCT